MGCLENVYMIFYIKITHFWILGKFEINSATVALPVTDKVFEFANALIHTSLWLSLMGNGVFRTIGHAKLMGKTDFSEI